MKSFIEKMKKWQLSKLIIHLLIFYVVVSLSLIGIFEIFAYTEQLPWHHFVLTIGCLAFTVVYFKKIKRHVIKIKRKEFD